MAKRNRAKCGLCLQIIESLHAHDLQVCSCGEISLTGGTTYYKAICKDPKNLLLIDEDGHESTPTFENKQAILPDLKKEDLMSMLKLQIDTYDKMSVSERHSPVSTYELQSLAMLIYSILKV